MKCPLLRDSNNKKHIIMVNNNSPIRNVKTKIHIMDFSVSIYKLSVSFLTLFFIIPFELQSSNEIFFKKISVEDGLSSLSVLSIYQDILGRMWFGTNEGVNLYNGVKIVNYKSYIDEKSKKKIFINGNVNQIVGDSIGNIFMRNNGRLVKYDIHNECFKDFSYRIDALGNINNDILCGIRDSLFKYNYKEDTFDFMCNLNIPRILCMANKDNILWLGTSKGLYLKQYDKISCILPDIEIFKLFYSSRNELWIATRRNGLYRMDSEGYLKKEITSPSHVISNEIRSITEDDQQNIWFGTSEGLQSYNPDTDKYSLYTPDYDLGGLSHKSVFSLFKDKQGSLWVGTYYGGVNYFNLKKDIFKYYTFKYGSTYNLNCPVIGSIIEDVNGYIWICTDGGGINRLDRKTGKFTFYTENDKNTILHNNIKSLAYDKENNNIYIGTYTGGLCRYELKNNKFHNYLSDFNYKRGDKICPNSIIYSLEIKNDWLYISAQNGFWRYDLEKNTFHKIRSGKNFINMKVDSYGYIWLATKYHLYKSHIHDLESLQQISLCDTANNKTNITGIYEASDKTIYISTLGNGIYSYNNKENTWKQYNTSNNNLLSDFCYNLIETPTHNLLITCDAGIFIYSPNDGKILNSVRFILKSGISSVTEECGLCVTNDNTIFVGGMDGMISFKEEDFLSEKDSNVSFHFSSLFINNKKITPHDDSRILDKSMPFVKELDLKYNQNNITIEYFFSNSVELEKNIKYQYKLDGFDNTWIPTEQMKLTYTNLPPGKYKLRLKEMNPTGREISLNIRIRKPWFANIWAYILYAAAAAAVAYVILRIRGNRRRLALSLIKEKEEKEKMEEINKIKFRFFTNVSHEFSTPLTLIMAQLDLLRPEKQAGSVMKRIESIRANAQKLRLLANELLDFRRLSQGFMNLKVEYVDFIRYINDIYVSFKDVAKEKRIDYSFVHTEETVGVWIDTVQFQKVVLNLLSNAFKYTATGGRVVIEVAKQHDTVELTVEDTGCGISADDSKMVFERFYQVDGNSTDQPMEGSGIGLALTKEIVEAHKGTISLESQPGKGSRFKVALLQGYKHFGQEMLGQDGVGTKEVLRNERELYASLWENRMKTEEVTADNISDKTKDADDIDRPFSVLVVENDKELMLLMEDVFAGPYVVYKAGNGTEGWDQAEELRPDIVISEAYLPGMTGKDLCRKIKSHVGTSDIPVVLVSAQASVENEMECYAAGADEYIVKPFDVRLLLAKCAKQLKSRNRSEGTAADNVMADGTGIMNEQDRKLHDDIILIIKQNFENPDFDVNALASMLRISRSTMFTRFKELFGMTPNELILKLKLEEAARMLKEERECNVSEVSYRLGFNSPQYFSRIFKNTYGVTPQTYRKMRF